MEFISEIRFYDILDAARVALRCKDVAVTGKARPARPRYYHVKIEMNGYYSPEPFYLEMVGAQQKEMTYTYMSSQARLALTAKSRCYRKDT